MRTHVSFSKVTVADFVASAAADSGVTEIEVILPLEMVSINIGSFRERTTYQKLKKSFTSFSVVSWEIPFTWTVVDILMDVDENEKVEDESWSD